MQQGVDTEKLARMFQDRYGLVVSVARRYAPSPDLAYDVAQQSFVDFFEYARKGKVDLNKDVTPLLYRIAKFRALKIWEEYAKDSGEAVRFLAEQLAENPSPDENDPSEELRMMRFCLEKLPPKSRDLIQRYYFHETPIEEIAREEERSGAAIRQAFYTIRLKLRECIERMLKNV